MVIESIDEQIICNKKVCNQNTILGERTFIHKKIHQIIYMQCEVIDQILCFTYCLYETTKV